MKIIIETISHESQRYETCGDWFTDSDGTLRITVSEMNNDDYNFLVGLHELVEAKLCKNRGINQGDVDEFDRAYERFRQPDDLSEPGDDRNAPYRDEHCIATGIERVMCGALGIPWKLYEETVERL